MSLFSGRAPVPPPSAGAREAVLAQRLSELQKANLAAVVLCETALIQARKRGDTACCDALLDVLLVLTRRDPAWDGGTR